MHVMMLAVARMENVYIWPCLDGTWNVFGLYVVDAHVALGEGLDGLMIVITVTTQGNVNAICVQDKTT